METEEIFRLDFTDDGGLRLRFSEAFYAMSAEEQYQGLAEFYQKKTLQPPSHPEVNQEMTRHEFTMLVMESLLKRLQRGERLEKDADLVISMDELMSTDDSVFF